MGRKPLLVQYGVLKSIYPLFTITQAGSALIELRCSVRWLRQLLNQWSVVKLTWSQCCNREASLHRHDRLKE